jgi:hypothetical protein
MAWVDAGQRGATASRASLTVTEFTVALITRAPAGSRDGFSTG